MESTYKGMTVTQIMAGKKLQPPVGAGINTTTVPISGTESKDNYGFAKFRNFYQGLIVRRMHLPNDTRESQAYRQVEWDRQSAMPWGNAYMHTPTDKERLNNPAQKAAVSQRQLVPPNSYQQWYAFMQAMSAAFGSLRSNNG
jgi:hypothetical protein